MIFLLSKLVAVAADTLRGIQLKVNPSFSAQHTDTIPKNPPSDPLHRKKLLKKGVISQLCFFICHVHGTKPGYISLYALVELRI